MNLYTWTNTRAGDGRNATICPVIPSRAQYITTPLRIEGVCHPGDYMAFANKALQGDVDYCTLDHLVLTAFMIGTLLTQKPFMFHVWHNGVWLSAQVKNGFVADISQDDPFIKAMELWELPTMEMTRLHAAVSGAIQAAMAAEMAPLGDGIGAMIGLNQLAGQSITSEVNEALTPTLGEVILPLESTPDVEVSSAFSESIRLMFGGEHDHQH